MYKLHIFWAFKPFSTTWAGILNSIEINREYPWRKKLILNYLNR